MKRAFVDTSAWYAFINASDPEHKAVKKALEAFEGRLVTSNFIFDETMTLCRTRTTHKVAVAVGEILRSANVADLVRATAADEAAAWTLFKDRSDKVYSFTDCTSFELMRRLKITTAIALDDDFSGEGFAVMP